MWRACRSIDIANKLGCDKLVLWLAREGTLCFEAKNPVEGANRLKEAINSMLEYDSSIKILIEPNAYSGVSGHRFRNYPDSCSGNIRTPCRW